MKATARPQKWHEEKKKREEEYYVDCWMVSYAESDSAEEYDSYYRTKNAALKAKKRIDMRSDVVFLICKKTTQQQRYLHE
jgi:hypothetical protein